MRREPAGAGRRPALVGIGSLTRAVVATCAAAAVVLGGCGSELVTRTPLAAERPGIEIDATYGHAGSDWTITGRVDPQGAATDVVLDVGPGPSTARVFTQHVPVASATTDAAPLTITTREIPDIPQICVRFAATNSVGTSYSEPLCFPHDLPSFGPSVEPPSTAFSAPAFGTTTVLDQASFKVTWTETTAGAATSGRSLQRRVAPVVGGACGSFADDGAASDAQSPVVETNLLDGRCYEWILTLSNSAGSTVTTSGIVRVARASSG